MASLTLPPSQQDASTVCVQIFTGHIFSECHALKQFSRFSFREWWPAAAILYLVQPAVTHLRSAEGRRFVTPWRFIGGSQLTGLPYTVCIHIFEIACYFTKFMKLKSAKICMHTVLASTIHIQYMYVVFNMCHVFLRTIKFYRISVRLYRFK